MNVIVYGPPGAGKTSAGQELARRRGQTFVDLDARLEARTGRTIPQLFAEHGEAEFRRLEAALCAELAAQSDLVIAPGGGALLDPASRAALERSGVVICLRAEPAALLARLQAAGGRPLLAGPDPAARLDALLAARRALYDSFPEQVETTGRDVAAVADQLQAALAPRTIPVDAPGLQHVIELGYGLVERLPARLAERGLTGPALLVTDTAIAQARPLPAGLPVVTVPAGEAHKTLETIRGLYEAFLAHGLDRAGLVIALGGGVLGDMAGFAAATYMRGVRWVNAPTTLLAMVDASLGGKTGVDLPQGKNLVGAFHPPAVVMTDPLALSTLPAPERAAGLAEVIKHGLLDEPALFAELEAGRAFGSLAQLERAIRVKVRVVEADPFERGRRALLNLGHTLGHGVEAASGFRLRHGEAVAVGLAGETRLAEQLGLARPGLAVRVSAVLERAGLPTRCPGLDPAAVRAAMSSDKKKAGGRLKFALARDVGDAVWGVEIDETLLAAELAALTQLQA